MFEFSSPSKAGVSFRSRMSESVLRQLEPSRPKNSLVEVLRPELRLQLRPVELRCVSVKVANPAPAGSSFLPGQPRLSAFCKTGLDKQSVKSMLQSTTTSFKRAASAHLFQRMSERLAHLHSGPVPRNAVPSIRASVQVACVVSVSRLN